MELIIVNIFSTIIETIATYFVILSFHSVIKKEKTSKKQQIIFLTCNFLRTVICTVSKNFIPGINTILYMIIEPLLITFILKLHPIKSLLVALANICIFAITEVIGVYSVMFIFNTTMDDLLISAPKLLCTVIFQFIYIILLVLLYFKITKKKPINFDFLININNKQILTLVLLLIICIFPTMLVFISNSYTYPIPLLVINSLQFILISIIAFILVKNVVEREKTQTELFTIELHNKTLIGMVDGVRIMKHDHNNMIQALNGYVLTKQYDKLQDHIKVLLKECNSVNNLGVIDPKIINEPAIYGVVGSKYFLSTEKDITFDLDIITDVSKINFPKPDLSRMMGILLDNAIEATLKTKDPYIRLEMHFDKRKCADTIKIYNTYDTSIEINFTDLFKKGYSTKEIKSGIGLWEVNKMVSKNPYSQIYAAIEGKYFVQTLIIERNDINEADE